MKQEFSRRDMLALVGGGALGSYLVSCTSQDLQPTSGSRKLADPLYYSSATSLADAIRRKEISSEEVVKTFLQRIEEVNPKLNAVVQQDPEAALEAARLADRSIERGDVLGPLHGVPITLKDSIDTADFITTGGTLGRAQYLPAQDASVAARLRAAGAILLGKTNTPEFTWSYETDNLVYGLTHNPYDLARTPGGSSGGAAAIVASGGSTLEIGSDTGGSIRYPCHCCGIAGIKPTAGRVPRTGHIVPFGGVTDLFTQLGPMARYVDDLILALPLISGVDWRDPAIVPMPLGDPGDVDLGKLRISFHTDNGIATPTPEVQNTILQAADVLAEDGLHVDEVRPDGIEETHEIINALWSADGGASLRKFLQRSGTTETSLEGVDSEALSMTAFSDLMDRWDTFRCKMTAFLENYDIVLGPANAHPARPHGTFSEDDPMFSYTETYNLTGWPGTVVRGGSSPEGLPIGIQIVARPWREDVALAVAKRIETALGGFKPPTEL